MNQKSVSYNSFEREPLDVAKRCIAVSCALHLSEYVLILVFLGMLVYAGMSVGESIG